MHFTCRPPQNKATSSSDISLALHSSTVLDCGPPKGIFLRIGISTFNDRGSAYIYNNFWSYESMSTTKNRIFTKESTTSDDDSDE